jgi:hypothetical protein
MLNALRNAVALVERLTGAFENRCIDSEHAFERLMTDDALLARFVDVLAEDAKDQARLTAYATRFTAAIAAGKYDYVSPSLTATDFPESVFGTVGEGHVLAQPPATDKGCWTDTEIDAWLASADVAGKGLEPAPLVDLLAYGAEHPDAQREAPIVAWGSLSRSRRLACLGRRGAERDVYVGSRDGRLNGICRFLLRKVQPKS